MKRKSTFFGLLLLSLLLPSAMWGVLPASNATGYLYNALTGKFLSHGVTAVSKSGALVDDYGVPVVVTNEGAASEFSGYTYLRLQMGDNSGRYLRIVADGLDCAGTSYHKWAAVETEAGILLRCIYQPNQVAYATQGYYLAIADDGTLVLKDGEENAAVWQWKSAAEQIAIVDEAERLRAVAVGAQGGLTVSSLSELEAALLDLTVVDKTEDIANPTMYANTDGWTVDNIQGTAINNGTYQIQNADGTQATVSQRLTDLVPGFYGIQVQAFYRATNLNDCVSYGNNGYRFSNAYIEAGGNKVLIKDWYAISTDNHSKPTSRSHIKDEFNEGEKFTHTLYTWVGDDGVLDLRIVVPSYSSSSNWICFNNVRLTYYFSAEDLSAYEAQLSAAVKAAEALVLPAHQKELLDAVVAANNRQWTTSGEYETAIAAIAEARAAAEPFVEPYAGYLSLGAMIDARLIQQTDAYEDEDGATSAFMDAQTVQNGIVDAAVSTDEIAEAGKALWSAALTWMKSVAVVPGKGFDLTWMIVNPDFSDTNYKAAWTEVLASSTTVGVTSGVMRYYNSSFDLSQTLPYTLPAGAYRLEMDGFERTNYPMDTAYGDYVAGKSTVTGLLYLNGNSKPVHNLFDQQTVTDNSLGGAKPAGASFYVPDGSGASNNYLSAGLYPNALTAILKDDAAVTIGYRCANTSAWTCFDNFSLRYMGEPVEEDFVVEATEQLTPLCLPFDLDIADDFVTSLCRVGSVGEGVALLYPVSHVNAGTPCVAQFSDSHVRAVVQDVVPEVCVLPWEGGILKADMEHFTWTYVDLNDKTVAASELTFETADPMAMDFSVNLENLAARKFLSGVTYTGSTASVVSSYNVAPPVRRDIPNRVMIPVPQNEASGLTLEYAGDEDFSDAAAIELTAGDSEAYIDHLLPQDTCYFRINADGTVLSQGRFVTTGHLRMLYIPTANNIRDLGGWTTEDGRRTAYGHLYRGSTLNGFVNASAEDLQTLRDLGVGAEIDLRWKEDYDKDMGCGTSPFGFTKGEDYYFAAANDYLASDLNNAATQRRLKEEFEFILKHFRQDKAVYFHCAWGADRTGMLAFLLEGVLGVDVDGIFKDYELTSFSPAGNRLKSALQERLTVIQNLSGATLRDRFENYFVNKLGVSKEDIEYFREVMLVDADDDASGITVPRNTGVGVAPANGKYLEGGRIVIVRDGHRYDVGGRQL